MEKEETKYEKRLRESRDHLAKTTEYLKDAMASGDVEMTDMMLKMYRSAERYVQEFEKNVERERNESECA